MDVLETHAGEWFTHRQVWERLDSMRPGIDPGSVDRTLRRVKAQGWGISPDMRATVCSSSAGEIPCPSRIPVKSRLDTSWDDDDDYPDLALIMVPQRYAEA
jgi:hypothetical protein